MPSRIVFYIYNVMKLGSSIIEILILCCGSVSLIAIVLAPGEQHAKQRYRGTNR
jgi:hypothetical protein